MSRNYEIDISNHQAVFAPDLVQLRRALVHGLQAEQIHGAVISVSVVDNARIHQLNREHLQHDYPTDVISFGLDLIEGSEHTSPESPEIPAQRLRAAGCSIEGEIVISAEMARETAPNGGWSEQAELQLYAIHGMLHLCGYDDLTPEERQLMRIRERTIMAGLGLQAIYDEDAPAGNSQLCTPLSGNTPDDSAVRPAPEPETSGRTSS